MTVSLQGVPVIRTERLVLRGFEARDLPGYASYRAGPRTTRPGGPMGPGQAAEAFAAMAGQWIAFGYGRYAICEAADAPALGHVGLHADLAEGGVPEMTWTLWSAEHEGRGYATEAARAVLARPWPWEAVPAHISRTNAASIRVAERLGGTPDAPSPDRPDALTYRLPVAA